MTDIHPRRPKTGGRKPGSLNKSTREVRELARPYAEQAIEALVLAMQSAKNEAVRVTAANSILDRAYGKPTQAIVDVAAPPNIDSWPLEQKCAHLGISTDEWERIQEDLRAQY